MRIDDKWLDLFTGTAFAHLTTLMPDGRPQATPVWINLADDGEGGHYLVVNSRQGRVKNRNMARDPRVAVSIQEPNRPYRYVSVMGRVVRITTEGGAEDIEALSRRYLDRPYPWWHAGEVREIFFIQPDRVFGDDF